MTSPSIGSTELTAEDRRRLLAQLLRKKAQQARRLPTSFAQRRLWLLDRLAPGMVVYNIPLAVRLKGKLNQEALERAFHEVVRRHETLRTRFDVDEDDEPVQVIEPPPDRVLEIVDLQDLSADEREDAAMTRAREEARTPFRLDKGHLLRATLMRLGPADHLLVVVQHHIISDGWSLGVLLNEVTALYKAFIAGEESPLPKLTIQYADYSAWQQERLRGETLSRLLGYWREKLAGLSPLDMPTDHVRPAQQRYKGLREIVVWPKSLADDVRELARKERATPYTVLFAGLQVLLSRYSGQLDVPVGIQTAGRVRKETEPLIGFFANTLVIRGNLEGDPDFREVMRRVRQLTMEAMQHQEIPFEKLVEELNPLRDMSRNPLFQVAFAFQNEPVTATELPGLEMTPIVLMSGTAKFDLWLSLREVKEGLRATLEYNVDLFEAETAQRMLEHLQVLLEAAVENPDLPVANLPLMREQERHTVIHKWNDTARDYKSDRCLHQLVEDQVDRTPDGVALIYENQQLTYREMNARANQLAHYLKQYGVGPDVAVGVCLQRSLEMVISLLAIQKAGGAYAPLDPDYPSDRLRFMIEDCQPAVVVTTAELAAILPETDRPLLPIDQVHEELTRQSPENPEPKNRLDDVAYVIYTSGSTGKPKGVRNEHRAICNRLLWLQQEQGLTPEDRGVQKTPFSFDVSVWEFFWPLLSGACLVVARPGGHKDPRYLAELIIRERVTVCHFVPSMLQMFLEEQKSAECRGLKRVMCSGEALPYDLQQRFFAKLDTVELHNLYGPTETAVEVTHWRCRQNERGIVPIGKPIANVQCYILDPQLNPQPIGVPGELHLGGVCVARDYLKRPELTAEKFIPDPFSSLPGARLYKTGDLCRHLPDGNIQFLGRLDFQVKIRGNRIELGEIQATLLKHPDIREAVATALKDDFGNLELVAYLVPEGKMPSVTELRDFLQQTLPEYMVPSAFVPLDKIPLNPNGKADLKALPRPERTRDEQQEYVAPRTPDEEQLAEIWSEVLRIERVGIQDNFFALGGHSLLATQVISRVVRRMNVDLPLRDMFKAPTIAGLAECIEVARAMGRTGTRPPIERVPRDQELPLSLTQEALWFLDRLEPHLATYTSYPTMRIRGPLDLDSLQRALDEIGRRHESLRTTFPEQDGRPVQVIGPPESRPVPVVDLTGFPEAQREEEMLRWLQEEMTRRIDLQKGPLVRITLLRLAEDNHVACVATHHIIHDGWSMGVLAREMGILYRAFKDGEPSPLPELQVQYADFAVWQRNLLQGENLQRLRNYWTEQLADAPPLDMPTDYPRPTIRSTRGDSRPCHLSQELSDQVKQFCQENGVTPFMTLLAAFQLLLSRYSGQDDITIGTPVANRTLPETEPLIGYLINMLILRTRLSGELSFRDLVHEVRHTVLEGFEHQDLTLDQVVEAVNPPRDTSRHPVFQAMFVLQNNPRPSATQHELQFEPVRDRPAQRSAYFELNLVFTERDDEFRGGFGFNTDLFAPDTIERMIEHYRMLLTDAIADPDRPLSSQQLVGEEEQEQLVADWAVHPSAAPRDACIHQLFEQQVKRAPKAVAIVGGSQEWTYKELNQRANRLAHYLRKCGVGPDHIVAVRLKRSPELVATLLAVLKAGGGYLPLDPALPSDRLEFTLSDAQVEVLVTEEKLLDDLPTGLTHIVCLDRDQAKIAACKAANPPATTQSDNLAYMIYTSGSTGRPKGVMIEHRALVNYAYAAIEEYEITAADRVLQFVSFSYDAHVEEVYPTLIRGATLVLRSDDMLDSCEKFFRLCDEWKITFVTYPTGFWHECVAALESEDLTLPESLRLVVIGGEGAMPDRVATWWEQVGDRVKLLNTYGPTEATVVATSTQLTRHDSREEHIPIGRPVAGYRAYVLDGQMRPVPIGVRGELYIGGESVARGYLNRPELTQERFVPDPFTDTAGAQMYKTGDVVRWASDGRIQFIGRTDYQVKIRGYRIEPGEVEQALHQHPLLTDAAVVARERSPSQLQLVAYVVGHAGEAPPPPDLRRFLGERLPEFMIPAMFIALDKMPMTTSSKVDRQALPEPDWRRSEVQDDYVAPRTETERQLAKVWAEVLNIDRVGANDSFFELGGNSLLALRLNSQVRTAFSIELPLVALFSAPTLAELAERITEIQARGTAAEAPTIRRMAVDGRAPLSFIQEQFWIVQQMFPGVPILNMPATLPVRGPLDMDTMRRTVDDVVQRHDSLRTTFEMDDEGEPVQIVAPKLHVDISIEDLSGVPEEERDAEVRRLARAEAAKPFDLAKLPLFRVRILRLSEYEHVLLLATTHIIFDGWSLHVLAREVAEVYSAFLVEQPSPVPPLRVQYPDFAIWQREYISGDVRQSLEDYWRNKLDGMISPPLPTDRPRQTKQPHLKRDHRLRVRADLRARLEGLCRSEGVTLYALTLTAFNVLLQRYCGTDDIAVTTPVANRKRPETQRLLGVIVNTIVLRNDLSGDPTFRELLGRVHASTIEAFEHEELPFGFIVDAVQPDHDEKRFPLSQVMFNYLQRTSSQRISRRQELEFGEEHLDSEPVNTRSDLVLHLVERGTGLRGLLNYDGALFDPETIERMAGHFLTLLKEIANDPDRPISQLPVRIEQRPPVEPESKEQAVQAQEVTRSVGKRAGAQRPAGKKAAKPPAAAAPQTASSDATAARARSHRALVPLHAGGQGAPLFLMHGMGGHVASFLPLAKELAVDRTVYGLQGRGLEPGQEPAHDRIEAMAEVYLEQIRRARPRGPYLLAGWSMGGLIAWEAAQQLAAAGQEVPLVAMIDTFYSETDERHDAADLTDAAVLPWIAPQLNIALAEIEGLTSDQQWAQVEQRAQRDAGIDPEDLRRLAEVCKAHLAAFSHYAPQAYDGRAVLFQAKQNRRRKNKGWKSIGPQLSIQQVAGDHYTILRPPHVDELARCLTQYLDDALPAAE